MKYIRKILSFLLILAVLSVFSLNMAFAEASQDSKNGIIYQTSEVQNITSGATLETKVQYTDSGWLTVHILRVDLTNPNVAVDSLVNTGALSTLSNVKNLAQSAGAVAAINTNFFIWSSKDSSLGKPIGPVVQSGQIAYSNSNINSNANTYATISINNLNQTLIDYWKINMQLVAPNGNSVSVGRYNQIYEGDLDYSIIDSKGRKTTIGTTYGSADTVEMLVSNGKVVEIRQAMPAVDMPENGYIVTTRSAGAKFLFDNFKAGDDVVLNISTTPNWSNLKCAVSGDTLLIKNGVIQTKFSHIASYGKDPRTAIGSTKDGKHLIMVAVDGKENGSSGLTLAELAKFMQGLGAYNALNCDGGGSTTMVARPAGETDVQLINNPSDGSMRKVSIGLGVFSLAPPSELDGLIIETEDDNVFVNTSRTFTVKGYDKYLNPLTVDPSTVKWSVSGIQGTFKGNTFYPKSVGTGKIKATVGSISKELEITSLSLPVQLELSDSTLKLPLNKTKSFKVTGKNKNGFYAKINPLDVKWTVKGDIGTFQNGVFTAKKEGAGYIDAQVGSAHAYCGVSAKQEGTVVKDSFETINGSAIPYPDNVTATYEISNEQAHSGVYSGKLTYDFPVSNDKRAAYIALSNGGLPLESTTSKLGIWVYNDHPNANWLGAHVYDSSGNLNYVYFSQGMDWTGWKYLEASLDGIKSPSRLDRIYLVLADPIPDSGSIYFDDLSTATSVYPVIDTASIPKDTVPSDDANKSVAFKKGPTSFRFSVFGQSAEPRNSLEKSLLTKLASRINSLCDASAIVGSSKHAFSTAVKKPSVATGSGYKVLDVSNSRFIQLDMSKKGLRLTKAGQWSWFLHQLNTAPGSNVFIFLAGSPKGFSDKLEADVFQNILTEYKLSTGKNVWVFYNSDKNNSYMERGIKYVSTAGFDVPGLKPGSTGAAQYILVTVNGKNITYEFKPII